MPSSVKISSSTPSSLTLTTAWITGAAKGIGRAYAIALAKNGVNVAISFHASVKDAETTRRTCEKEGVQAVIVQGDVEKDKDVQRMHGEITNAIGAPDALICNVGDFIYTPTAAVTADQWENIFANNFGSVVRCVTACLPAMKKKKNGRILTIGTAGVDRNILRSHTLPYYVAKHAVLQYTKAMAAELARYHITINSISPGIMASSVVKHAVPAGRDGTPDDLVNAMLFLFDKKSGYVNGANIEINGGWAPDL